MNHAHGVRGFEAAGVAFDFREETLTPLVDAARTELAQIGP